jgi:hypothetical protein
MMNVEGRGGYATGVAGFEISYSDVGDGTVEAAVVLVGGRSVEGSERKMKGRRALRQPRFERLEDVRVSR